MRTNTFQQLAETAQSIAETPDSDKKISLGAAYLHSIHSDGDLSLAVRFLSEGAFPASSDKRIAMGSRTYSLCAAEFCEIDYEQVFKPCKNALGSASEAIEKLMHNIQAARNKRIPMGLSLADIEEYYNKLARLSSRADKQNILRSAWKKMTPAEIKYFIRIIRGAAHIGLSGRLIISIVAEAFDKDAADVRRAHIITGSMGRTALLAKHDQLDEARFTHSHPLAFMHASPLSDNSGEPSGDYVAEEKFDGLRAQVHVSGKRVRCYSRNHEDITGTFPEIAELFASRNLPDVVFDGVICVFKNNEIHPSQLLRKRTKGQRQQPGLAEQYPVLFIAFDLLFHSGRLVTGKTLRERRRMLEKLSENYRLPIANQFEAAGRDRIKKLAARSMDRGNEGLILKDSGSRYHFGQRGQSWLSLKRPGSSLNTVIMYAHTETGRQNTHFSGFTLGIRVSDDERYEEEFIPIGKARGIVDEGQMSRLRERIDELTAERYGPTLGLIPGIVVELEFDDIQVNKRTKANYVLHRPRFNTIRWNADPAGTDTLKKVEHLYRKKINRDRLKQNKNPSFIYKYQ